MYVSVVIPTYNRKTVLERTIHSLLNQTLSVDKYEIIVVDDCSIDDTSEYLRRISENALNMTYIRHQQNEGRVVTRNDGIKAAHGDVIILTDDDNVPAHNFVEKHLKYYDQDEKVAVVGNVSYASEIIGNSNFAIYLQSRYLGNRPKSRRSNLDYNNLPPRCFGTLNCSARKIDLLEVGMFDSSFRYYGGEDEYLGQCLKEKGIRLVFGNDAHTVHYDLLSLARYKDKILESAKYGLNILSKKKPDYLENTMLKYLIPVSLKKDKLSRIFIKATLRAVLNRGAIYLVERWATYTDHFSFLYCYYIYRALISGWIIRGQKLKYKDNVFVSYGERIQS
jgi:glycosyltransferase involved in cell wall biosynthesis